MIPTEWKAKAGGRGKGAFRRKSCYKSKVENRLPSTDPHPGTPATQSPPLHRTGLQQTPQLLRARILPLSIVRARNYPDVLKYPESIGTTFLEQ